MAQGVTWSFRAEHNLQSIFEYIAQDSEIYAARFVKRLVLATEAHLPNNRLAGRLVPEFTATPLGYVREFIFKGYRVIYDPEGSESIVILAVLSGRMRIEKQFELE
ncbi:MAG: type II toxin-antitoxin system RelE/ParE family toxin [Flavobacteriales bacterium]|jgi:toxin ParE1/3/4|nr:type II toxin-antitoxin system RelE/ParE family toxin [Flavobacteriales bacterium]